MLAGTSAQAETLLRWNQAGYAPGRPIQLLALSEQDLAGQAWRVVPLSPPPASAPLLTGQMGASVTGVGAHSSFPFNHLVDLSMLRTPGRYRLTLADGPSAELIVAPAPYARLLPEPLLHLRAMRSGSAETRLRKFSHPGDARALVWVPAGDPANGHWQAAAPARTVNLLGGWYDAGDQIKFTLNHAYTVYHLLLAYRQEPALFRRVHSVSDLPDILDEARHGLEFLARTFPDPETFVIQVGDERDHEQVDRLPENDPLDGQRPALCALSRVHMHATTAALALGARTFLELGRDAEARRYSTLALAIHARTRQPGTVATAFERGKINDFYHDPSEEDQAALAAMELHALTGDATYLEAARRLAPRAGTEVSWAEWHWLANAALAPHDPAARERLLAETETYAHYAATQGAPWRLPTAYTWGSLHRWIGAANAARMASRIVGPSPAREALFYGMLDYTFGCNNWGVAFLFSPQLPNSVQHLYSPAYQLLGAFPTGALSEGPGARAMHEAMARHFRTSEANPLARFDTAAAVFSDSSEDFMCQEATITGQADAMLLLTLASLPPPAGTP